MKKFLPAFAASVILLFAGCQQTLVPSDVSGKYGTLVVNPSTVEGAVSASARAVYVDAIKAAIVTVRGYDSNGTYFERKSGVTSVTNGAASNIVVDIIPVCDNASVEVQAYGDTGAASKVEGVKIYAATQIIAGTGNNVTVNWSTSVLGKVHDAILQAGENLNTTANKNKLLTADALVNEMVNHSVHSSLVDADTFAADFKSGSLKAYTNYVKEPAVISVETSDVNGYTIQISDPLSKVPDITEDGTYTYSVAPGTWTIYAINSDNSIEDSADITVGAENTGTVTVSKGPDTTNSILVKVPSSYGYVNMYVWDTSDSSINQTHIALTESGDYYTGILNVTSTKIILTKAVSAWTNQTGNMSISEAGEYIYNGSSFDKQSTSGTGKAEITVGEISGPVAPSCTVPSTAYVGGTFTITVTSNVSLSASTVTVGGVSKTLSIGTNTFNVSDFLSAAGTIAVTGTLTNSAGSVVVNQTISVVEKPVNKVVSNPNELRIYQICVPNFQDGDTSIGYGYSHGPDNHISGGDLQGIINAIPYIKALGCNAIWMTPIFYSNTSTEKHNASGYFPSNYFDVDYHFGSKDTLKTLIKTCHENGINVILDGVFGHNASSQGGSISQASYYRNVYPGSNGSDGYTVDYTNSNSITFYEDVARYWIEEFDIDGWRLDQCYQLGNGENNKGAGDKSYTNGHNYWYEIRKVVSEAAATNGTRGQDWGTLGYMVGEHWMGNASIIQASSVAKLSSSGYGLQSCFDFPSYYIMMRAFAQEQNGKTGETPAEALTYLFSDWGTKGYAYEGDSYAIKNDSGEYQYYPNFFLSNHDLPRIGNMVASRWSCSQNEEYYKRNQVILAAQAAYTGPITIYYGDEFGDMTTNSSGSYSDNVSRTSGKISGFSTLEQATHDYTAKLLKLRSEHEALWNGTSSEVDGVCSGNFYAAEKTGGGETIYVAFNYDSSSSKTFSASGTDLITGTTYSGTVTVPALSAVYVLAD